MHNYVLDKDVLISIENLFLTINVSGDGCLTRNDIQMFMILYEKSQKQDSQNLLSLIQLLQYVTTEECMPFYDYGNLRKVS